MNHYISECEIHEGKNCLSEKAKEIIEKACNECLMHEANEFDADEHESHTYEGYINECVTYLKEMLGNRGYSDLGKHYKR